MTTFIELEVKEEDEEPSYKKVLINVDDILAVAPHEQQKHDSIISFRGPKKRIIVKGSYRIQLLRLRELAGVSVATIS